MEKKDFLSFLKNTQAVDVQLDHKVQNIMHLELISTQILRKFILILLIGGLISLLFIPQFGFGGWDKVQLLTQFMKKKGAILFSIYSGAGFFFLGTIISIFVLKKNEISYLVYRAMNYIAIFVILFWALLRLIQYFFKSKSIVYGDLSHLLWITSGIVLIRILFFIKSTYKIFK
jgi:hypothetical protein